VQKIEIFDCYGISSAFEGGRHEDEEILRLKLIVAIDLGATTSLFYNSKACGIF